MKSLVTSTLCEASYQPNGVLITQSEHEQQRRALYIVDVAHDVNSLVNTQAFKDKAYEKLDIIDCSTPVQVCIKVTDNKLYVRKLEQSEWKAVPIDSIAKGINQEILAKGAAIWAKTVPESGDMPPSLSTRQTVPIETSQEITRLEEALKSAQDQEKVKRRVYEELRHSFGTQSEQLPSRQEELNELRLQNGQLMRALEAAYYIRDYRQEVIECLECLECLEQALQGATGRNATMQNELQVVVNAHEEELARVGIYHLEVLESIRLENATALGAHCQASTEALDALRQENIAQVRQLNDAHQAQAETLRQEVNETAAQIQILKNQHLLAIEYLKDTQVNTLSEQEQKLNQERDQAINTLQLTHTNALSQLKERLDQKQVAALAAMQEGHEKTLCLRDEAHALAIQSKDHDLAGLRRQRDEATQLLKEKHANALRQLTERLGLEKTQALHDLQRDHIEALRDQGQRLGEDKKRALELLQTQNAETLRVQTKEHASALEELRKEQAGAIDAAQLELQAARVQQRAAQEGHEREIARLTSAFAGERAQYESSNHAIQEQLQAAELRIKQHDHRERGQAEELRRTQTSFERKVQALEERYRLIAAALLDTDHETKEVIELDTFSPVERIRAYRAAASEAEANYKHLLAENEDITRGVRSLQRELAAAHVQHERDHEELSRALITSTEERDRLKEQAEALQQRIQQQSETIGRLTSENLHLKQQLERAEGASSSSSEDLHKFMAIAEREKLMSDAQLASQKIALEEQTALLADTQNHYRQIEDRNSELRGQMKDLDRAHKQRLEEVNRNRLTAARHAEELHAKTVELDRKLCDEQTANVDACREKDVVISRHEATLKDLTSDKAINLAALAKLQTTAQENTILSEEKRRITTQLLEAKQQGDIDQTRIQDLENRLRVQKSRVEEISAEREVQITELDEQPVLPEALRDPTATEIKVANDALEQAAMMRALREKNDLIPIHVGSGKLETFRANQVLLASANLSFDLDVDGNVVLHVSFKTPEIASSVQLDQETTIDQKTPAFNSLIHHQTYRQLLDIRGFLNYEILLMKTRTNYHTWNDKYRRLINMIVTVNDKTREEYAMLKKHLHSQTENSAQLRENPDNVTYKQTQKEVAVDIQETLQKMTILYNQNAKTFPRIATDLWALHMLLANLPENCYNGTKLKLAHLSNMNILINTVKSSLGEFFGQVSLATSPL